MELEIDNTKELIDLYDEKSIQATWTNKHFTLWCSREEDLNSFLFYFHLPKEKLRTDSFSEEEVHLLMETLHVLYKRVQGDHKIISGSWGIISLLIPYRNGMQCYDVYNKFCNTLKLGDPFKSKQDLFKASFKDDFFLSNSEVESFLQFFEKLSPGCKDNSRESKALLDALNNVQINKEELIAGLEQTAPQVNSALEKVAGFKKSSNFDYRGQIKRLTSKLKREGIMSQRSSAQKRISNEKLNSPAVSSFYRSPPKSQLENGNQRKLEVMRTFEENCILSSDYDSEPDLARIFKKYLKEDELVSKKIPPSPSVLKIPTTKRVQRRLPEFSWEKHFINSDDEENLLNSSKNEREKYSRVNSTKNKFNKKFQMTSQKDKIRKELKTGNKPRKKQQKTDNPWKSPTAKWGTKMEIETKARRLGSSKKEKEIRIIDCERQFKNLKLKNNKENRVPVNSFFKDTKTVKDNNKIGKRPFFEQNEKIFETNITHLKRRKLKNATEGLFYNQEYEKNPLEYQAINSLKCMKRTTQIQECLMPFSRTESQSEESSREKKTNPFASFFINKEKILTKVNYFEIYQSLRKKEEVFTQLFSTLYIEKAFALNKLNRLISFQREMASIQIVFKKVALWELDVLLEEIKSFYDSMLIESKNKNNLDFHISKLHNITDLIMNIFEKQSEASSEDDNTVEIKLRKSKIIGKINDILTNIAFSIDFFSDLYQSWPAILLLHFSINFLKNLKENEVFFAEYACNSQEIEKISTVFDSVLLYLGISSVYSLCFKNDIIRADIYRTVSGEDALGQMVEDLVLKKIVVTIISHQKRVPLQTMNKNIYSESFELFSRAFKEFLEEIASLISADPLTTVSHNKRLLQMRRYMKSPGDLKGHFNIHSFIEMQKSFDKRSLLKGFFPGLFAGVLNNHFNEDFIEEDSGSFIPKFRALFKEIHKMVYLKEIIHLILSQGTALVLLDSKIMDITVKEGLEVTVIESILKCGPFLLKDLDFVTAESINSTLLSLCSILNLKTQFFISLNAKLLKDLYSFSCDENKSSRDFFRLYSQNPSKIESLSSGIPYFLYPGKICYQCIINEFGSKPPDNKDMKRLLGKITPSFSFFPKLDMNSKEYQIFINEYFVISSLLVLTEGEENLLLIFNKAKSLVGNMESSCLNYKILLVDLHLNIIKRMSEIFMDQGLSHSRGFDSAKNYLETKVEKVIASLLLVIENLIDFYRELSIRYNRFKTTETEKELLNQYLDLDKILQEFFSNVAKLSETNPDLRLGLMGLFLSERVALFFETSFYFFISTRLKVFQLLEDFFENQDFEKIISTRYIANSTRENKLNQIAFETSEPLDDFDFDEVMAIHSAADNLAQWLRIKFGEKIDKIEIILYEKILACYRCQYDQGYIRDMLPRYRVSEIGIQKVLLNCLAYLLKHKITKGDNSAINFIIKEFFMGSNYVSFKEPDAEKRYDKMNLLLGFHEKLLEHMKAKNGIFLDSMDGDRFLENLLHLFLLNSLLAKDKNSEREASIFKTIREASMFIVGDRGKFMGMSPKRFLILSFFNPLNHEALEVENRQKKEEFSLFSLLFSNFRIFEESLHDQALSNKLLKALKDQMIMLLQAIKRELSKEMNYPHIVPEHVRGISDILHRMFYLNYKMLPLYKAKMPALEAFFLEIFSFLFGNSPFKIIMLRQSSAKRWSEFGLEIEKPEILLFLITRRIEIGFKYAVKFLAEAIELGAKKTLLMDILVSIMETEISQNSEKKRKFHNSRKFLLDMFEEVSKGKDGDDIEFYDGLFTHFIDLIKKTLLSPRSYIIESNKRLSPEFFAAVLPLLESFLSDVKDVDCLSRRKRRLSAIILYHVVNGIMGCELLNNIIATDPKIRDTGDKNFCDLVFFCEKLIHAVSNSKDYFYCEEMAEMAEAFTFFQMHVYIGLVSKFDPLIKRKLDGDSVFQAIHPDKLRKLQGILELPTLGLLFDERVNLIKKTNMGQKEVCCWGIEGTGKLADLYGRMVSCIKDFLGQKRAISQMIDCNDLGKETEAFIKMIE